MSIRISSKILLPFTLCFTAGLLLLFLPPIGELTTLAGLLLHERRLVSCAFLILLPLLPGLLRFTLCLRLGSLCSNPSLAYLILFLLHPGAFPGFLVSELAGLLSLVLLQMVSKFFCVAVTLLPGT